MSADHVVHVELPAAATSVDALQDEVSALWRAVPSVVARDRMRFEMALVEIFANVVQHSLGEPDRAEDRKVVVEMVVAPAALTARFVDDGRPAEVDLQEVRMPSPDAEGGRGLALTLAAVDHLEYERDGGTNRWTVTCRRAA